MRFQGAVIAIAVLAAAASTAEAGAPADTPLFATDSVLSLTMSGPLSRAPRNAAAGGASAGLIELEDGTAVPVTFTRYGLSRRRECTFPPFAISIAEEHSRGTPFEGILRLRLVTPCHLSAAQDRYVLLEYLVYAGYGVIAEPALRVRLVRCRFRDSDRPASGETVLAFLLEDIGVAAGRYDMEWLDIAAPDAERLDPGKLAMLALFQFMVGNTDWSAVSAAPGERCCHNVAVLGKDGDRYDNVVPFDFDQTGLVDPPYAVPDERLAIRRVTDRLYRGFCWHNAELPEAIQAFNDKRTEIEELFDREELPLPKVRKRAWKYLDASYEIINDPEKLSRNVVKRCR